MTRLHTTLAATNCLAFGVATVGLGAMLLLTPAGPAFAEDELRQLAEAPELSTDAVLDGSYTEDLETWVADRFPYRDRFLAANVWLRDHRGARDEAEPMFYAVDLDGEQAQFDGADEAMWAYADELDPERDPDAHAPEAEGGAAPSSPLFGGEQDDPDEPTAKRRSGKVEYQGGVFVHDGRAMQIFGGSDRGSPQWADAVGKYEEVLGDGVRITVGIAPSAQEFYLPESAKRRSNPELPNIEATYDAMASGIAKADIHGALSDHTDEYIFFRTDHHWTGLGAYYAYRALCDAADLTPVALSDMEEKSRGKFWGSLLRVTQDKQLRKHADTVDYWVPPVAYTAERWSETRGKPKDTKLLREHNDGYAVFLGHDYPLMKVKTDVTNGRRAVFLKNSMGNPVGVYLASHFEELYIVDYRYYDDEIEDLVADNDITDVIILFGVHATNVGWQTRRLRWVLDHHRS